MPLCLAITSVKRDRLGLSASGLFFQGECLGGCCLCKALSSAFCSNAALSMAGEALFAVVLEFMMASP